MNPTSPGLRRTGRKRQSISPLALSLLHLLPSLLLSILVIMGFLSLSYSNNQETVLGSRTSLPQIKVEKAEDRLQRLIQLGRNIESEALEKAQAELEN